MWYDLQFSDDGLFFDEAKSFEGSLNIIDYCKMAKEVANHPVMSVNTFQSVMLRYDDVENIFVDKDYMPFADENNPLPVTVAHNGGALSILQMKAMQFDYRAYNIYGIELEEGTGFTKENVTINTAADTVPVILGNDYRDICSVGQEIDMGIAGTEDFFHCRVEGIVKKGMLVPDFGVQNGELIPLDAFIIFPYGITIQDSPAESDEINKFAILDILAMENAKVFVEKESEFRELVSIYQTIGSTHSLPAIVIADASMGLRLLRDTSAVKVRIMLLMTIIAVLFVFYGLAVTFYNKIKLGQKVYGIYLMNGCSLWMILASWLLELLVIVLPSLCLCRIIFVQRNFGFEAQVGNILNTAYGIIGLVFVLGAIMISVIFRGIDLEKYIKGKE
ncbi:MAG: hypothetical protein HFH14_06090, partial [Lachnospiraceae bacterium]|nr:hypothetical protein [Lachnospiraceae bacterium]